MTAPIIDRDAIIEKAARVQYRNRTDLDNFDRLKPILRQAWIEDTAAAIDAALDDLLAPIEALHCLKVITAACAHCKRVWPCPTAQAVAAIREAVRA